MSTSKTLRHIRTRAVDLTATAKLPGGMFREPQVKSKTWRVLDSTVLAETLQVIRDGSHEPHVKANIQTLLDQIARERLDA